MFCFHKDSTEKDLGNGLCVTELGAGERLSVLHWNLADGSIVPTHQHEHEQFGYVISGGFAMTVGDERATLAAGDSYFIPANSPHGFVTIGQTEAIDVFAPVRTDYPWAVVENADRG